MIEVGSSGEVMADRRCGGNRTVIVEADDVW